MKMTYSELKEGEWFIDGCGGVSIKSEYSDKFFNETDVVHRIDFAAEPVTLAPEAPQKLQIGDDVELREKANIYVYSAEPFEGKLKIVSADKKFCRLENGYRYLRIDLRKVSSTQPKIMSRKEIEKIIRERTPYDSKVAVLSSDQTILDLCSSHLALLEKLERKN
jgi:hypothetical protein